MEKAEFLAKLVRENKLRRVLPSEAIKDSHILKSDSNLAAAKLLLRNNMLEESVVMSYYSMYHMLTALLFKTGIKSENHSASIMMMKDIFQLDNADIIFAKRERIDKQYYADFSIAKKDAEEGIFSSENFRRRLLDFLSRMDRPKVIAYQDSFDRRLKEMTKTK